MASSAVDEGGAPYYLGPADRTQVVQGPEIPFSANTVAQFHRRNPALRDRTHTREVCTVWHSGIHIASRPSKEVRSES